ncbi:MAG TPA: SCO1664 family protein [Candidatus Limnocylindrales bacterium]
MPADVPAPPDLPPSELEALRTGELEILGRLRGSSNNAMVVRVWPAGTAPEAFGADIAGSDLLAVWKPTIGERPLFDFPIGTLTRREVAAYLVSEALGWGIVPPTLLREGPYGEGMLQRWIEANLEDDVVAMVNGDDPRLRRIAVLDAILNNTDRKAGHLLPIPGGHLHAVDHGVTFSIEPKLRTVLWAWEGEPFDAEEVAGLGRVRDLLGTAAAPGPLGAQLVELLFVDEVDATRARIADLLASGRFPSPNPEWPAIPWPPY